MQLIEAISKLDQLPDETFICVRQPWGRHADTLLVPYSEDLDIPPEVLSQGFVYFLEVHVAREILDGFLEREPSLEQITDLILFYAENDAFPEWADST
jgi:hypothetical protein